MKLPIVLAAACACALGGAALAQSPAGIPADPNTNENQQPGPSATNPTDPAAGSNPGARAPTSPPGTGQGSASEGAASGEAGSSSPAGIPADPTTDQNVQPGPGIGNPSDPATASDPAARVPTAPEKQQ